MLYELVAMLAEVTSYSTEELLRSVPTGDFSIEKRTKRDEETRMSCSWRHWTKLRAGFRPRSQLGLLQDNAWKKSYRLRIFLSQQCQPIRTSVRCWNSPCYTSTLKYQRKFPRTFLVSSTKNSKTRLRHTEEHSVLCYGLGHELATSVKEWHTNLVAYLI